MASNNLAKAHANIALIKYWGKKDDSLILPYNSSISITLDALYTETLVEVNSSLIKNEFYLNDQLQSEIELTKVLKIVNLFRTNSDALVKITSKNNMPTAAGIASSSSGIAALVLACDKTFNTNLDKKTLSRYARYGSGSACRSIYPGFVRWEATNNDITSIGYPIESSLDLSMIILLLSTKQKTVFSRDGMKHCVETSPYYKAWVESTTQDYQDMLIAIKNDDFMQIGELTEKNALKMHATTLAANPPFTYLTYQTYQAIEIINQIKPLYPCFYTMDAGPNVKILCQTKNVNKIKQNLLEFYTENQIIVSALCKST